MEWDNFLPFYLPNNSQNQNFEKMKKTSWRCHHVIILHMCTKITIIWCMLPEIWTTTNIFFGDIILLHMHTINEDHMIYYPWDIRWYKQSFFVILGHFLPFEPPNNLEKQNFEKIKKKPGYIITLHLCTTNDIMIYASWDMECNRLNVFFILDHFLPFYPPSNSKIEILKKWKKNPWHIIVLRQCNKTHGHMIICYTVPEIWCVTDAIFIFHFGLFFALCLLVPPPNHPKKQN